jgi:hypothetical protein
MFNEIPDSVRSGAQEYCSERSRDTRKKPRMKEFRGIMKEGISRWWIGGKRTVCFQSNNVKI